MNQYQIKLTGITPLLMHRDNVNFSERRKVWQNAPENKGRSIAGDDRSPAWSWIGCVYHDSNSIVLPSDNIMTMLREGGAKVVKKGKETYKKHTQSGIILDRESFAFMVDGKEIPMDQIKPLMAEDDFSKHVDMAESLGFELLVKRARVGSSKHVRVRPMFRNWSATGSITVLDAKMSGLDRETLTIILTYAGALCGIGDWRPSSPSSGTFGRFEVTVN